MFLGAFRLHLSGDGTTFLQTPHPARTTKLIEPPPPSRKDIFTRENPSIRLAHDRWPSRMYGCGTGVPPVLRELAATDGSPRASPRPPPPPESEDLKHQRGSKTLARRPPCLEVPPGCGA